MQQEQSQKLKYLYSLTKWDGKSNFGLDNLKAVLSYLDNPQDKVKSIHVAGTNGKGSTSVMLAAGIGAAGFNVALTTSPHLERMTERFVINGVEVEEEWVGKYAAFIEEACEKLTIKLTFHEALTAIAFIGFADSHIDYMVVEVGLGGRLDATNVLAKPELSIITSIGYDHQEVLGNTLEKIAIEKAGIIKTHVPVLVGLVEDNVFFVIEEYAKKHDAPIERLGVDFEVLNYSKLTLQGQHQQQNAGVVFQALKKLGIKNEDIEFAFSTVFWPGRLETFQFKGRNVLIDCAHNSHGTAALVNYLNQFTNTNFSLIYGTLNLKDWHNSLNLLQSKVKNIAYFKPESERALSGSTIAEYLKSIGFDLNKYRDFNEEYDKLPNYINKLDDFENVLITGSIYLVGKLRSILGIPKRPLWVKR